MSVNPTPPCRIIPAPDVHVREFDGELVLLDLKRGEYFSLNEIGLHMWNSIGAGTSLAEVAKEIAISYEIEEVQALSDLIDLRDKLLRAHLVLEVK